MDQIVFFGGGGSMDESIALDTLFFGKKDLNVLLIPFARDNPEKTVSWFNEYKEHYQFNFKTMGVDKIDQLQDFDAIYISGGNTYLLQKKLLDKGLHDLLKGFIQNDDKMLYGGSAGAVLLGKSIDIVKIMDKNEVGPINTQGLNMLDDFCIFPHYTPRFKEHLLGESQNIIAITQSGGIISDLKGKILVIGDDAVFFKKGKLRILKKDNQYFLSDLD